MIIFNVKKSKISLFGKSNIDLISPLVLNDKPLEFVTQWNYLGVTVVAGSKLSFSATPALASF